MSQQWRTAKNACQCLSGASKCKSGESKAREYQHEYTQSKNRKSKIVCNKSTKLFWKWQMATEINGSKTEQKKSES